MLPNVLGKLGNIVTSHPSTDNPFNPTGSFWTPTFTDGALIQTDGLNLGDYDGIGFDASKSSTVYKNTTKIQVRSAYVLMIVKS